MEQQQTPQPPERSYTFEITMTCFILLLLIMTVVYFTYQQTPATGGAFITLDKGKEELQDMLVRLPMTKYLGPMEFCVQIVLSPEITHSYDVLKTSTQMLVSPSMNACSEFNNDLVLRFPSYEKFKDLKSYPTCHKIVNNGRGQNYWFLPSRLWPLGDTPNCNADFQAKVCPAIYYCIDPKSIPGNALSCCVHDKLTQEEQQRADGAVSDGIKRGVREQGLVRI